MYRAMFAGLLVAAAACAQTIDGDWQGALEAGTQSLRLLLHIRNSEDGLTATLDSLDQNARGLPVTTISRQGNTLKFEMKQLAAAFEGALNADLSAIDGTFTQMSRPLPLVLKRQKAEGQR